MNRLSREQVEQWLATAPPKASVYLVGAGGCGMSGLAHLLLDLDLAVQGSDLRDHAGLRLLRERGAVLHEGHALEQLRAPGQTWVYSSAIRMDNPELALAQQLGIPLVRRAVLGSSGASTPGGLCGGHAWEDHYHGVAGLRAGTIEGSGRFAVGAGVPQLGRSACAGADASAWFSVRRMKAMGPYVSFIPNRPSCSISMRSTWIISPTSRRCAMSL